MTNDTTVYDISQHFSAPPEGRPRGLSITAGNAATHSNGTNHVPKASLVSNLQIMFQNRILTVSNELPQAGNLRRELPEMRAASHHYGDLAMSLARAAWQARTNFRAS